MYSQALRPPRTAGPPAAGTEMMQVKVPLAHPLSDSLQSLELRCRSSGRRNGGAERRDVLSVISQAKSFNSNSPVP
jgi:hypothetical protein